MKIMEFGIFRVFMMGMTQVDQGDGAPRPLVTSMMIHLELQLHKQWRKIL